jgi:hypothetical protein
LPFRASGPLAFRGGSNEATRSLFQVRPEAE